eukprot:IDg19298t1
MPVSYASATPPWPLVRVPFGAVVLHSSRILSAFLLIFRALYVAILIFRFLAVVARVGGHFYHCSLGWECGELPGVPFGSVISWVSGTIL